MKERSSDIEIVATVRTRESYCCQKVGSGADRHYCLNAPTRDLNTNYGFIGSVCDVHYRLMLEALGGEE